MFDMLFSTQIIAEAAITWTPLTFYVAVALLQAIIIVVGFKVLQVDPEHNAFIGAALAVVVIAAAGYFTRDTGLVAVIVTGVALFGMLMIISGADALKSIIMAAACLGAYFLVAQVVLPRTPLTVDKVGGITKVMTTGGIEDEPFDKEIEKEVYGRDNDSEDTIE